MWRWRGWWETPGRGLSHPAPRWYRPRHTTRVCAQDTHAAVSGHPVKGKRNTGIEYRSLKNFSSPFRWVNLTYQSRRHCFMYWLIDDITLHPLTKQGLDGLAQHFGNSTANWSYCSFCAKPLTLSVTSLGYPSLVVTILSNDYTQRTSAQFTKFASLTHYNFKIYLLT